MIKTAAHVKFFLKAKKPEGLRMLMLNNNIKRKAYHDYKIVFAEGFWYAWYDTDAEELLKEEVDKLGDK